MKSGQSKLTKADQELIEAARKLIADGTYKAILDKYTVGELAVDSIAIMMKTPK